MILITNQTNNIPIEVVEQIIDFIDYKKYHKPIFQHILNDITEISTIFNSCENMQPRICYLCWGSGWKQYDNLFEDHFVVDHFTQFNHQY